jgi:hypothetical protein
MKLMLRFVNEWIASVNLLNVLPFPAATITKTTNAPAISLAAGAHQPWA